MPSLLGCSMKIGASSSFQKAPNLSHLMKCIKYSLGNKNFESEKSYVMGYKLRSKLQMWCARARVHLQLYIVVYNLVRKNSTNHILKSQYYFPQF